MFVGDVARRPQRRELPGLYSHRLAEVPDDLSDTLRVTVSDRRLERFPHVIATNSETRCRIASNRTRRRASDLQERVILGIYTEYVRPLEPSVSVPHALLALLSEEPKHGLRLQTEFELRTGEVWPLNVGQVYTTLQRLERDRLVETDADGERSQKRYRITPAGAQELADWLRTPPDLVPPPRDVLVIKVLVALQVPGTDVHEILQVHRRHAIEVMQRYTRVKAAAAESDVALALVADAELFRLEAIVRWLDAADVRLKQLPSSPPAVTAEPSPESTPAVEVSP